jgi:2-dehydro-3-deoxygalactonokinase
VSKDFFLSVDWGTSNFRLRLVEKSSVRVIKESTSSVGIKNLYLNWQKEGGDREFIFLNFLKKQIHKLDCVIPEDTEIVLSGMASSNIGIRELPYAALPFNINGDGLYVELIKHSSFPYTLYLISGVCSDSDIIRGEETQMMGLAGKDNFYRKSIFILPGTHSKHIVCENGKITAFNTFITGELFQAICNYTILKVSIEKPPPDTKDWKFFDEGVIRSQEGFSLLNDLFKIRATDILGKRSPGENYYYLSGLLIGEELAALKLIAFDHIELCAGNNLYEFYERAIRVLNLYEKTTILDSDTVEASVIKGQLVALRKNNKTEFFDI